MNHIKAYDTPDRAYDTRDSSMTINSSTVSSVSTGGKTLGFASSLHDIYTIGEVKSSSSKKIRHDRSSFDEKLSNGKMSITSSNLRRDKKTKSHKPKQNGWTKKGDHNNTVKEFGRTSKCSANIMPKENDQPKKCSSINMSDENDRRKNGNTNNKPKKRNHTKIKLPTKEYDCDAESAKCYFYENYNMMQGMERMNNTPEPSQEQLAAIIGLNFLEGLEVSVSEHVIKRVRVRDHRGETRLHRESRRGHLEKVKELLKMGADPNTMDNDNFTPLHEYKALENVEICRVLLEHGADPRKSGGMSEMTPLHVAVIYNYLDAIPLLIQHGADILATGMYDDGDLFTPLSFAKENGNGELVKLLKTEWNKYLRPKESDRIQFNHEVLTPIRKALRETNERLIKSDKAMKCVIKHIVVSALSAESQVLLNQFSTKFEIEVDRYFGDSCDALVVEKKSTGSYKRTSKLMTAIVNNGVVIDKGWIKDSLKKGKLLPCDDYLVDSFQPYKDGIKRARKAHNESKKLFSGLHAFVSSTLGSELKSGAGQSSEIALVNIILSSGGAKILPWEPKPTSLFGNEISLACGCPKREFVAEDSPLSDMRVFVVTGTVIDGEEDKKYKPVFPGLYHVSTNWLYDCVVAFAIQ